MEPVDLMATASEHESEIDPVYRRLAALDVERRRLEARLSELQQPPTAPPRVALLVSSGAQITNSSPATDKIALFRRLFGGRTDVFPARWDNPKTGRSGYPPACANEWVRGVCGKPGNNVMAHGVASAESANRIENSLCAKLIICITHSCFDLLPRAAIPTSG